MKKHIFIIVSFLFFISCEEIVHVDLEESEERLVINASLNWFRNYPENTMDFGNEQIISLSKTVGYYNEVQAASNAVVRVTNNDNNEVFNFFEESNSGIYKSTNFKPLLNNTYTLYINYNGEDYTAEDKLIDSPVIDSIQQIKGGFFRDDEIVLHVYYKDNGNEENYYYFDYITSISDIKSLSITNDRFVNGNSTYQLINYRGGRDDEKKIEIGDVFDIKFFEINSFYYQYLNILTDQIYNSGMFDPIPAEVKGNIINLSNEKHYPYGFFRIALGNKASVIINEEDLIVN